MGKGVNLPAGLRGRSKFVRGEWFVGPNIPDGPAGRCSPASGRRRAEGIAAGVPRRANFQRADAPHHGVGRIGPIAYVDQKRPRGVAQKIPTRRPPHGRGTLQRVAEMFPSIGRCPWRRYLRGGRARRGQLLGRPISAHGRTKRRCAARRWQNGKKFEHMLTRVEKNPG